MKIPRRFAGFPALLAIAFLALAGVGSAQTPAQAPAAPPAGSDAALKDQLRLRVQEFFQFHIDHKYRQAFEMVAEDTKDEYFASGKIDIRKFTVDDIQLADDKTHATVKSNVGYIWAFQGEEVLANVPMETTWKIEDGKWVWYHTKDPRPSTPMGVGVARESTDGTIKLNDDGTISIPKEFSEETVLAAAQNILGKTGIDKNELTLSAAQPSEQQAKVSNANFGQVDLALYGVPQIPGLSVKLDKTALQAQETATLSVSYTPPQVKEGDTVRAPTDFSLRIEVTPLNQILTVAVKFEQ